MRQNICLAVVVVLSFCVPGVAAETASTEVTGTMVIPAAIASFEGSVAEIRLYEYDRNVRHKPVTLIDREQIKDIVHTTGTETRTPFSVGLKPDRKINLKMRHFVTLFIHSGDPGKTPRTHIGQVKYSKGRYKVLSGGNPKTVVMVVAPMKGKGDPKPVVPKAKAKAGASPTPAARKPAAKDYFTTIQQAQFVFTADLKQAQAGPVARSLPPIYNHRLILVVREVLRGDLEPGVIFTLSHTARQQAKPVFPVGKFCLVTARQSRGTMVANLVLQADDKVITTARDALLLPIGWSKKDDKFVSPWLALRAKGWPKSAAPVKGAAICRVTGRPAFLAGAGVSMKVMTVPPVRQIKDTNPDGDGSYVITITNDTDKPVTVPALLSGDRGILWTESLVILCQDKARPIPGAEGLKTAPWSTVLKPKQAVSTVVNTFALRNIKWPRGGYRLEFQFCLGELSVIKSFYYMSRHHDAIRQAVTAKLKK